MDIFDFIDERQDIFTPTDPYPDEIFQFESVSPGENVVEKKHVVNLNDVNDPDREKFIERIRRKLRQK